MFYPGSNREWEPPVESGRVGEWAVSVSEARAAQKTRHTQLKLDGMEYITIESVTSHQ